MNRDRKILGSPRTWGLPIMQLETQMGLMLRRVYEKAPPIYEFLTMWSLDFFVVVLFWNFALEERDNYKNHSVFYAVKGFQSKGYRRGGPKVG